MYCNKSLKKYLDDLAAKTPSPGGGSAAALSAAMAASLVAMACEFTLGNRKYKKSDKFIKKILSRSTAMHKRLAILFDEDIEAYSARDVELAIQIPAEICFLSHGVMVLAQGAMEKGNKRLITDAGLAILLAEAGFFGALSYIEANILEFKQKSSANMKLLKKIKVLRKSVESIRRKVEANIGNSFGW